MILLLFLQMFVTLFLQVSGDHPPQYHHHPPQYHHQPHYDHVPGFLEVHIPGDHGRSEVKYDYGYGRRNHLYTIIGYPHHHQHHF